MRAVIDRLVSWMAVVVAVVLLIAGGLLVWAHNFIGDQVHTQLSQQQITMPAGAALTTPEMKKELGKYAGQQMTTGPQAKAYANYFIGAHLKEMGGGKSYAQISSEQMAAAKKDPNSAQAKQLAEVKQEMFQGNTLRGLLLYGYAFATMGTIAGIAAIASFAGAALVLLLAILGLLHARRSVNATRSDEVRPAAAG